MIRPTDPHGVEKLHHSAGRHPATSLLFIKGRVKFGVPRANGRQVAASHPSALVGWNVDLRRADELGTAFLLRDQPPAAYVDVPLVL